MNKKWNFRLEIKIPLFISYKKRFHVIIVKLLMNVYGQIKWNHNSSAMSTWHYKLDPKSNGLYLKVLLQKNSRGLYYKKFCCHNLWIFVISFIIQAPVDDYFIQRGFGHFDTKAIKRFLNRTSSRKKMCITKQPATPL